MDSLKTVTFTHLLVPITGYYKSVVHQVLPMDCFDDIQIEEFSMFDFVEEAHDGLFEEDEDDEFFRSFVNSDYDL